ncbi:MAG TPA: YceI family protein [Pseudonocardiaceae bacterium]
MAFAGQHQIGPAHGKLVVRTFREGIAAGVGHDLTLEITGWSADLTVDDDHTEVAATIDLGTLVVRTGTGGVKPLSDRDRRDIAHNARKALDTDHGPTARFVSTTVTQTDGGGTIEGTLTLHGKDNPFTLQVTETEPGHYRATGTLRQTDYGIKPHTAFFGALKLADQVEIEVEVAESA